MNGQETRFPTSQLSNSMYQELTPQGAVRYETGSSTVASQFTAQGLPVSNTLTLPLLPETRVVIGQNLAHAGQALNTRRSARAAAARDSDEQAGRPGVGGRLSDREDSPKLANPAHSSRSAVRLD